MKKTLFLAFAAVAMIFMASCDKEPDVTSGATVTKTYNFVASFEKGNDVSTTVQLDGVDSTSGLAYIFLQISGKEYEMPFSIAHDDSWNINYTGNANEKGEVTLKRKAVETDATSGATFTAPAEKNLTGRVVYILKTANE